MPLTLEDLQRAIADEQARIEQARGAVIEAREALTAAEADEREITLTAMARIEALRGAAKAFEGHGVDLPLHNPRKKATINPLMETEKATRTRGQRLKAKNVGAVRIRKVDGSINAFAEKHKLYPTTVYGWYAEGAAGRKIPAKWADFLERKPYNIPRSTWPNGVLSDGE